MIEQNMDVRLKQIEKRLIKIEDKLGLLPETYTVPVEPPMPEDITRPETNKGQGTNSKPRSGNWLGIIAVVCFILAAGFIIKLSVDTGWLTPLRQLGIAATLGVMLIGVGLVMDKVDKPYAGYLPAAGIIILYLTAFASHRIYGLVSFGGAISLCGIVSLLCIWLYTRIRHDVYSLTAATGAYLAPILLDVGGDGVFALYYFLVCTGAFSIISIWLKSRTMILVSSYLAILMTGFIGLSLHQDKLVAGILVLHFMLFSVGNMLYSVQNKTSLTQADALAFLPVMLLFYANEYRLIDGFMPDLAPWISMGFAAFLIVLYLFAKKAMEKALESQSLILAFAAIVGFHAFYLELLPVNYRPGLFVLIFMGLAFIPNRVGLKTISGLYKIPLLVVACIAVMEYLSMISHLLQNEGAEWLVFALASIAGIWLLFLKKGDEVKSYNGNFILLGAAHLMAIAGLYRLTQEIGSIAVSAAWLFYAVTVMFFSYTRKDDIMAKSALFVLGFAAGKALLYDASSAPTIIRILCLLLTGAVLYSCGIFIRKVDEWSDKETAL